MAKLICVLLVTLLTGHVALGATTNSSSITSSTTTVRLTTTVTKEITTLISETDLVSQELHTIGYCHVKLGQANCDIERKLLDAAINIDAGVCGLAKGYVNCFEKNCISSDSIDKSIQVIRDRCNGSVRLLAAGLTLLMAAMAHILS